MCILGYKNDTRNLCTLHTTFSYFPGVSRGDSLAQTGNLAGICLRQAQRTAFVRISCTSFCIYTGYVS